MKAKHLLFALIGACCLRGSAPAVSTEIDYQVRVDQRGGARSWEVDQVQYLHVCGGGMLDVRESTFMYSVPTTLCVVVVRQKWWDTVCRADILGCRVCVRTDGFRRRASVAGRRDNAPVCVCPQVSRRGRDKGLDGKSGLSSSQAPTITSELAPCKTTVGAAGGSRTCARGGAPALAAAAGRRRAARSATPAGRVSPVICH